MLNYLRKYLAKTILCIYFIMYWSLYYITIIASESSITSPFHLYIIETAGIRQTPTAMSSFNRELQDWKIKLVKIFITNIKRTTIERYMNLESDQRWDYTATIINLEKLQIWLWNLKYIVLARLCK